MFAASTAVMKGCFVVVVVVFGVLVVPGDVFAVAVEPGVFVLDDAMLLAVFIAPEKLEPSEVVFVVAVEDLDAFAVAFPIIMAVHRCYY